VKVKNFNVSQQHSKNVWACKIVKCAHNIFTKCLSQECLFAWHTNRENAPRTFCKPCRWRTSKMCLNFTANSFVFGGKNREIRPELFHTPHKAKTSEVRLNFTVNSFVFGHINGKNAPRTFCKPCRRKTSKMCLNFAINLFVFGRINRVNAPSTVLSTSQGENIQNESELRRKELHFGTHKSRKCAQNFVCKSSKWKLPECVWTSKQTALFLDT